MSRSHPMMKPRLLLFLFLLFSVQRVYGLERIPIRVQRHRVGAPLTLGVPLESHSWFEDLRMDSCVRLAAALVLAR